MSLARLLPQLANLQTYNFEINFDVSIIIIIKSCNHVLSGMYQKLTIFETPRIFYPILINLVYLKNVLTSPNPQVQEQLSRKSSTQIINIF